MGKHFINQWCRRFFHRSQNWFYKIRYYPWLFYDDILWNTVSRMSFQCCLDRNIRWIQCLESVVHSSGFPVCPVAIWGALVLCAALSRDQPQKPAVELDSTVAFYLLSFRSVLKENKSCLFDIVHLKSCLILRLRFCWFYNKATLKLACQTTSY